MAHLQSFSSARVSGAGHVANGQDALGTPEVGLLEELPESLVPHDVPDGQVHVALLLGAGHLDREHPLRDLGAHGGQVPVVEGVVNEAPDEGGLAHGDLAGGRRPSALSWDAPRLSLAPRALRRARSSYTVLSVSN